MNLKKLRKFIISGIVGLSLTLGVVVNANEKQKYANISEFLSSAYELFFLRNGQDDEGFSYWEYSISKHEFGIYDFMISLVYSEEFVDRNVSNEEFISIIYKLILTKEPNEDEMNYWIDKINEENEKLSDMNMARANVLGRILNEEIFKELVEDLNVTFDFINLNNLGVESLSEDYPQKSMDYIDSIYKDIDELQRDLNELNREHSEEFFNSLKSKLPIFLQTNEENDFEEILHVEDEDVERLVYGHDYEIKMPYDEEQSVYISPFIQFNKQDNSGGVDLAIAIVSKGLGRSIEEADIVYGDKEIDFLNIYSDDSKFDSDGLSINEFVFSIGSLEDLKVLDEILGSDLAKLRFTYDDGTTYVYNLSDKDRVKNTLKFMGSVYNQIMVPYLYDSAEKFRSTVAKNIK